MLPVGGITNGAVHVLGFNYGARQYGRVREGIRIISIGAFVTGLLMTIMTLVIPGLLIKIFNSDAELISKGIEAFRIYFVAFFFMAMQLAGQAVSQALGRAKTAIFFSMLRKAIVCGPLTIILPRLFNLGPWGVFIAEPISDFIGGVSCFLTMIFAVYIPLGKKMKEDLLIDAIND